MKDTEEKNYMLNCCILMGRLTRDPQVSRFNGNGTQNTVVNSGLAVDRDYNRNGEKITSFFEIKAWNKSTDFAEKYLRKGQLISVK